jgi:hypothetical protein
MPTVKTVRASLNQCDQDSQGDDGGKQQSHDECGMSYGRDDKIT